MKRTYGDTINKYIDNLIVFNDAGTKLPYGGGMSLLTGIATGTGSTTRIGSSINVYNIDCNLYVANLSPTINYQNLRLIVFTWYGSFAPLPSMIIPPTGPGHLIIPYNYDFRDKFNILVDRTYATSASTATQLNVFNPTLFDNFNIDCNQTIDFSDSTTGLGVGDIYCLCFGDTSYAGTFISLDVQIYFRIKFSDY